MVSAVLLQQLHQRSTEFTSNKVTTMRKTVLSVLACISVVCASAAQSTTTPPPATAAPPASTAASCVIKDADLEKEYDHEVDYANPDVKTDFYLLVYSHSPSFCAKKKQDGKIDEVRFQCASENKFGWVIHGLWGESAKAFIQRKDKEHPRFCKGDLPQLDISAIKPYLCMSPGARLLQGEWEKHGACDFKTADEYFAKAKELSERFKMPPSGLRKRDAMNWMKKNNPELKDKWLYLSGSEFGICFDKDFKAMSCPR